MEMMDTLARGVCKNCGRKITQLQGEWSEPHWTHDPEEGRGVFERHCPGAPVAEPDIFRPERGGD